MASEPPTDEGSPPPGPLRPGLPAVVAAVVVGAAATGAGLLLPGADLTDAGAAAVRVGGGIAGLAALAVLVVLTRRAGEGNALRTVPIVLATAAVALAAVGALTAPFSPIHYDQADPDTTTTTGSTTTTTRPDTTTTTVEVPDSRDDPDLLVPLVQALVLAVLLALLVYAFVLLLGAGRLVGWWRAAVGAPEAAPPPGTLDAEVAEAGLAASLDAVTSDLSPRDAISDAYARLLAALDAAGAGRRPHEAPHEHLDRVFGPLGVRSAPLHTLAGLFVLARFSQHPVTDAHRARAGDALREALADLRAARPAVDA